MRSPKFEQIQAAVDAGCASQGVYLEETGQEMLSIKFVTFYFASASWDRSRMHTAHTHKRTHAHIRSSKHTYAATWNAFSFVISFLARMIKNSFQTFQLCTPDHGFPRTVAFVSSRSLREASAIFFYRSTTLRFVNRPKFGQQQVGQPETISVLFFPRAPAKGSS